MHDRTAADSIGQRKHRFVQSEISATALALFADKGFDQATVNEIAREAGISRRTFFRYFETKEDVVVTALARSGDFLMELIEQQPLDDGPMGAIHRALREFLSYYQSADPKAWRVLNLIQSTPKLRARFLYQRDQWLPRIVEILTARSISPPQAEVAAATALGVLALVYDRWHRDESLDVARSVDEVFNQLQTLHQAEQGRN